MELRALQPEQMQENHRAAAIKAARGTTAQQRPPMRRNLEPILALGDEEFIQWRGRAYGVPPVPLKAGQRLLETYLAAIDAAREMALLAAKQDRDPALQARYFGALEKLPAQLWALSREPSRPRRWIRRLGLRRNPFLEATEAELLELAHFFYERRTRSGAPSRPIPSRARRISSMT